jgi:tetratricopeptide (TPR) repeat protein
MEIQALNNLGNIANNTGDQAGARGYYAASMARANEVGDPRSTAIALGNIATLDFAEGDLRSALTQMQEALKLKRGVGDRSSIAYTLIYLGRVSTYAGNFSDARRYFEEADALQQAIHEKSVEPAIFLAQLSIAEGKPEAAEAAMLPMAPRFQKPNPAGNIWRVLTESRLLKGEVGKAREAADQAVSWGRKTPNRADFGIPCDLISARVEIAEKNFAGARKHLMDLLAESRKLKHMVNEFTIRLALVELEAQSGNLRAATEASHSLARDSAQHGFGLIATAAVRAAKTPVLAAR